MTSASNPASLGRLWDIDVLTAPLEPRLKPVDQPAVVLEQLGALGIRRVMRADSAAAVHDARAANDRAFADSGSEVVFVPGIDLRDPVGALDELERRHGAGDARLDRDLVRVWVGPASGTAARLTLERAVELGYVLLLCGDFRSVEPLVRGLGADVVFLDTHFYQVGDFVLAAGDEPGYRTSTRLLNSPDALELVAGELGAERMLFGTGAPDFEPLVPVIRLSHARLGVGERDAIAWGNAVALFGSHEEGWR